MKTKRLLLIIPCTLLIVLFLILYTCGGVFDLGTNTKQKEMTCEPIPTTSEPVLHSMLDADFVDMDLREYEILGKWHVVGETGYVICRKGGELWSTYYEKDSREVGVLTRLLIRIEEGDTIIYSEKNYSGEYMAIRPDGLYIYGEAGLDPYVWPNE